MTYNPKDPCSWMEDAAKNVKYTLRHIFLTLEIYYKGMRLMRKNNFGYAGLLGLIGLLGFANFWLFFNFSFFALFAFLKGDERTDRNVGRATRNAFVFDTIVATLSIAYVVSSKTFDAMPLFVALLSQGLTIFGLSYWFYEEKGIENPHEDENERV